MNSGPLAACRVVELASEFGAFAGKILADLGAEVIVVEPPGGHRTRRFEPFLDDTPDPEGSLWWWHYNTGKLGVVLDLGADADRQRLVDLIAESDVVLEAEPPGDLAALGVDYHDIRDACPELVWVSITPFGRSTSRAHEPATDLTLAAGAGPAWSCGYDDHNRPPVRPGGSQSYHTACLWAVMGTLTALYAREALGGGQFVDVSMHAASNVTTEAATYEWLVAQKIVQRQTFRHAAVRVTPPRIIRAGDDGFVITAVPRSAREFQLVREWVDELGIASEIEECFFLGMAVERGGVGLTEIESDPEAAAMYQTGAEALRRIAGHLPAERFFFEAQCRGLVAGVVLAPEQVMDNEHFVARGFPVDIVHEDLGRTFAYPGAPFHASESPWRVRGRAPHVGEHQARVER